MRREKHLNIIEIKLNVNLNSMTMDQLRESRKRAVLDFGTVLLRDSVHLLSCSEGSASLSQLEAKLLGQLQRTDADSFNDMLLFRSRINELFNDWKAMMQAEALRLKSRAEIWYAQGDSAHLQDIVRATETAINIWKKTAGDGCAIGTADASVQGHMRIAAETKAAPDAAAAKADPLIHLINLRETVLTRNAKSKPKLEALADASRSRSEIAALVAKKGDACASAQTESGTQAKALHHYDNAIKLLSAESGPSQNSLLMGLWQKKALVLVQKVSPLLFGFLWAFALWFSLYVLSVFIASLAS